MGAKLNVPDLAFALFLVALGALAFALASELPVGSAAVDGPGLRAARARAADHDLWRRDGRARGCSRAGSRFRRSRCVRCC